MLSFRENKAGTFFLCQAASLGRMMPNSPGSRLCPCRLRLHPQLARPNWAKESQTERLGASRENEPVTVEVSFSPSEKQAGLEEASYYPPVACVICLDANVFMGHCRRARLSSQKRKLSKQILEPSLEPPLEGISLRSSLVLCPWSAATKSK